MGQAATQQSGTTQGTSTKPPVSAVPPEGDEAGAGGHGKEGGEQGSQTPPKKTEPQTKPGADGELDSSKWDDDTRKYIEKLRKESADRRTKANNLETKLNANTEQMAAIKKALGIEDGLSPEEELQVAQARMYEAQNDAYLKGIAIEQGISYDNYEYFQFLVNKRASELDENEELSEEALGEIVSEAKKRSQSAMSSTSVTTGSTDGKGAPPSGEGDEVTIEAFVAMNISERSQLYTKNPELYSSLMAKAKEKRMLL